METSQVGGVVERNGGMCSRLIPSLQLPPILNHTIRICQRATRLVFAHSGGRRGQMASRDTVQSCRSDLPRTRSPPREQEMLSPFTVVSCLSSLPLSSECIPCGHNPCHAVCVCVPGSVLEQAKCHFLCRIL